MDQSELMNYVVDALERHDIPYAVTGSHASNIYGETRFTNDIDVVIDIPTQQLLDELLMEFPEGSFYVSDMDARHAVANEGGQFNIIHEESSQKVDLIIRTKTHWPDQFSRRTKVATTPTRDIWFVSLEDLVLKKMDFYREGGSDKHLRDISGTLRISSDKVDMAYITHWAEKLGLKDIWEEILSR